MTVITILAMTAAGTPAPLAAWTAVAAVAAVLLRRPPGFAAVTTGAACAVSVLMDVAYRGSVPDVVVVFMFVEVTALVVLTALTVRRAPAPYAAVVGALLVLTTAALPLRVALRVPTLPVEEAVIGASLALAAAGCAVGVGLYLRSLDVRRTRAITGARRKQRHDLARDLHDFIAHEVTAIVLEAQAAQVKDLEAVAARAAFGRIEQAGVRALASLDHTLYTLDEEGETSSCGAYGLSDLPALIERFATTGTAEVAFDIQPGLAEELPREAESTAYRVVVEALTNIRRHAWRPTHVTVAALRVSDSAIEVSICDDGGATSPPGHRGDIYGSGQRRSRRHRGGTGLIGLTERVTALGGTLSAGPCDTGWRVTALLPTPRGSSFHATSIRD
ncbi:histidine kinase [Actinomadura sp. ATCC 31491]|uniref:histidine kinase n=1 Tax=Actinomadura luzonensis TaxID=2805427 RepID=A0ABT0FSA0_9ACTN|nr:histidine kinase [Actinomadura luzonensis]MCK2215200.1 histidine kinase [Actinomadura luzonensis]